MAVLTLQEGHLSERLLSSPVLSTGMLGLDHSNAQNTLSSMLLSPTQSAAISA